MKRPMPLWATLLIAAFALGIGIAAGSGSKKAATTAATPVAAATTVYVTTAGPASSQPAPAPAPQKSSSAPAPAATTVALKQSGNGIKTTQSFTVGPDWSVAYTFNCASFGTQGNFAIYEDGGGGGVLANALAAKGGDTTYQHDDPGKHSLEINSECDWTITVTDGDSG